MPIYLFIIYIIIYIIIIFIIKKSLTEKVYMEQYTKKAACTFHFPSMNGSIVARKNPMFFGHIAERIFVVSVLITYFSSSCLQPPILTIHFGYNRFTLCNCKKNLPNDVYVTSLSKCNELQNVSNSGIFCFFVYIQQKQPLEAFYKTRCSQKFRKIYRKTPVADSLF